MHDIAWFLFLLASVAVIATPGQDMVLVMARSVSQGPLAGIVTAAGVSVGLLGHTALAALGLGALLRASDWAFVAIKFAGAAYLVWIGWQLLRSPPAAIALQASAGRGRWRLFADGALSNLGNPKIAIFYFAYLPQFIGPGPEAATRDLLMLGAAFAGLTFLIKAPVGGFAGLLSGWIRTRPAVLRGVFRTSGAIMIGLGLKLAFERR